MNNNSVILTITCHRNLYILLEVQKLHFPFEICENNIIVCQFHTTRNDFKYTRSKHYVTRSVHALCTTLLNSTEDYLRIEA